MPPKNRNRQIGVQWKETEKDFETISEIAEEQKRPKADTCQVLLEERLTLFRLGWGFLDKGFLHLFGSIAQMNKKGIKEVKALVSKIVAESGHPGIVKPVKRKRDNIG